MKSCFLVWSTLWTCACGVDVGGRQWGVYVANGYGRSARRSCVMYDSGPNFMTSLSPDLEMLTTHPVFACLYIGECRKHYRKALYRSPGSKISKVENVFFALGFGAFDLGR
ncbi:hypothetical protein B0H12DRAFT_717062 [Mycena haematopus]|nr:hypothetical protein B0H12DRAFT_717062 [Mycena haematopus]